MADTIDKKFDSIKTQNLTPEQMKAYKWAQEKGTEAAMGWYIKNYG